MRAPGLLALCLPLLISLSVVPHIVAWEDWNCRAADVYEICDRLETLEAEQQQPSTAVQPTTDCPATLFVGQLGSSSLFGSQCEWMGPDSSIGFAIGILLFMTFFFTIWNTVSSAMLVTPIVNVYRHGCSGDALSGFLPLICPHWIVGLVVPVIMWGLIGIALMIFPQYARMVYSQVKESRPGGASSGTVWPDGAEPGQHVQTSSFQGVPGNCRFAYEPPHVSDDSESNPNMGYSHIDDHRGCPSQTTYGFLEEHSASRQPWEPQRSTIGCFYELRLPTHETRVIDGFMLKAFENRRLICVKVEKCSAGGSWTSCNGGQVYFPSWEKGADGIEEGTAIQRVDELDGCSGLRIYPVVWSGGADGKIALSASLRVKPQSAIVIGIAHP